MKRKRGKICVSLPVELVGQLDDISTYLTGHPSRSGLVEDAIREFITKILEKPEVQEKRRQAPSQGLRVVGPPLKAREKVVGEGIRKELSAPPRDRFDEPQGGG